MMGAIDRYQLVPIITWLFQCDALVRALTWRTIYSLWVAVNCYIVVLESCGSPRFRKFAAEVYAHVALITCGPGWELEVQSRRRDRVYLESTAHLNAGVSGTEGRNVPDF